MSQAKEYIKIGMLHEALEILSPKGDEAILLQFEFSLLQKHFLSQLISSTEYRRECISIAKSALLLAQKYALFFFLPFCFLFMQTEVCDGTSINAKQLQKTISRRWIKQMHLWWLRRLYRRS